MTKWKNILKIALLLVAVIAFLGLTLSSNRVERKTDTKDVQVQFTNDNLQFITVAEIIEFIPKVSDSVSTVALSDIDIQALEAKVETNDFVENCEVFINNKKQLGLKIQQKQPLFRVLHQSGVSYYVDKRGIKFPKSPKFTANVPIVSGQLVYDVDSVGVQQSKAINDLVKLFEFAEKNEAVNALVSSVSVQTNGDLVIVPRMGKHLINIGSSVNLDDKFKRLFIFYKEGLNKIGWDQYEEINLKFEDQIIAKKKS